MPFVEGIKCTVYCRGDHKQPLIYSLWGACLASLPANLAQPSTAVQLGSTGLYVRLHVCRVDASVPISLCGEGEQKQLGEVASYKVLFISDRINSS